MRIRVLLLDAQAAPSRPARRMAGLTRVRWLLLAIAVGALGYSGHAYLDSTFYQAYQDWSFERAIAAHRPFATVAAASGGKTAARSGSGATAAGGDSEVLGRIAIPRLSVRAMVKEGVDDRTLRRAVGHVPETVRPGTPGNIGLAGHRDSFFRRLKDVRKGDRIVMETLAGTYQYIVESMKVVGPMDVHVLAPSKESFLTLVTCYPFHYVGNAPRRYIVRARQVSADVLDPDAAL